MAVGRWEWVGRKHSSLDKIACTLFSVFLGDGPGILPDVSSVAAGNQRHRGPAVAGPKDWQGGVTATFQTVVVESRSMNRCILLL